MRRVSVFIGLVLCSPSGCGTVSDLQKGGSPYGGVCKAANEGVKRAGEAGQGRCIPPFLDYTASAYWLTIDLPLSAIGDTVVLPWTFTSALGRTAQQSPKQLRDVEEAWQQNPLPVSSPAEPMARSSATQQ